MSSPFELSRSRCFWSKSPPTTEIIEALESNIAELKPMYVAAPPNIVPELSFGVSISSKATVPTINVFFKIIYLNCFHIPRQLIRVCFLKR